MFLSSLRKQTIGAFRQSLTNLIPIVLLLEIKLRDDILNNGLDLLYFNTFGAEINRIVNMILY